MKTIRIFISSPGDVQEEREVAKQVIQGLRKRYAAFFDLRPVLWEYLPLQADASFQEGVDLVLSKQHGIDIAVFILWSRLGTPLGAQIRRKDGTEYRSGTEREFDLVLTAREATGGARPHVLVYVRSDEPGFRERLRAALPEEREECLRQKSLVTRFIEEEFHDAAEGTNVRAYHTFEKAASFSGRLRAHLQELLDAQCQGLRADPVWDIEEKGSPFRGLRPFQFEHTEIFFGREDEIVAARTSLQEAARNGCAFLLVTGASGAGKSSLARAGILPAIVENEIDDAVRKWRRIVFTPGSIAGDLPRGISEAVFAALPEIAVQTDRESLALAFARDPRRAIREIVDPVLRGASNGKGGLRLIILADQLEELFTDEGFDSAKRAQFAELLDAFARCGEAWVVATVRGDFYARCQEVEELMVLKADGAQIDVLPPRADAIRRMIESPASLSGLSYERSQNGNLADLILAEASHQAELLPLLQDLLEGLCNRRGSEGLLTVGDYRELGGISGALAKRAEAALAALPAEARQALPLVLRQLVRLDESAEGEGATTRRHATLNSFPPGSPERLLVDSFVKERLLVADRSNHGESTVTLTHEALIRAWPRIGEWVEENKDFLRQRSRLSHSLQQWRNQGSHKDLLLARGLPLTQAEHLLEAHGESLGEEEKEFIRASRHKADNELRRASRVRSAAVTAVAIMLLSAAGGGVAVYLKHGEAQREKAAAEARKNQARSYYLVHGSRLAAERGDFRSSLQMSGEAYARHRDFTTRSALLEALQLAPERLVTSITGFGSAVTLLRFGGDGSLCAADAAGGLRVLETQPGKISVRAAAQPHKNDSPLFLAVTESDGVWTGLREDGTEVSPQADPQAVSGAGGQVLLLTAGNKAGLLAAVYPASPSEVVLMRGEIPRSVVGTLSMPDRISALAVSDTGLVAVGTMGGEVAVANETGAARQTLATATAQGRITALEWDSAQSGRLAAGDSDGNVHFWKDNATAGHFPSGPGRITDLAWSPDGTHVAASRSDGDVVVIGFSAEGVPLEQCRLEGHAGPALCLAWSPQSEILASGGEDGTVLVWHPFRWPGPFRTLKTGRDLRSLSVSRDGRSFAAGSADGALLTGSAESFETATSRSVASSALNAVAWKSDGSLLAFGDSSAVTLLRFPGNDNSDVQFSAAGRKADKTIWRIRWSPDDGQLAYTSHSGAVAVINATDETQRELSMLPDYALGLAWAPDKSVIAAGSTDGKIRRWQMPSCAEMETLEQAHTSSIGSLAYSPDSTTLASCSNDGTVALWKSEPGSHARTASVGHYLEDVIFSPDGRLVCAVGADGYLRAWSSDDADPRFAVKMADDRLWALSKAGWLVYVAGSSGEIRSLDFSESIWENRAREIVGTDISGAR